MKMTHAKRIYRFPPRQTGVNLIELMVTLVIVGILTGIAYPSFMQSVRKGHRSDAHMAMTKTATNLERFFSTNGTYTVDASLLGLSMEGGTAYSDQGHYVIAIGPGGTGIDSSYVVSATAKGGDMQEDDDGCTEYSLSSLGVRIPDPVDSKCW